MYFLRRLYDTINDGEVPANQKIFIGMASICDFFLSNVIGGAMLIFYTDYIGLQSANTYGTAFLFFGLWNMINDPIFAYLSDKRVPDPKWGKRRPFLVIGPPLFLLGFIVLIFCPMSWSDAIKFWYIFGALFIYDLGIAMFNVNISALIVTVTKDPNERSIISMLRSYLTLLPGALAGIFPSYIFTSGYTYEQILLFFVVIALVMFALSYLPTLRIKEPIDLYKKVTPIETETVDELTLGFLTEDTNTENKECEFDIIDYGFVRAVREVFSSKTFLLFALYTFFGSMMVASYYDQLIYLMKWVYRTDPVFNVVIAGAGGATINIYYILANKLRQKIGIVKTLYFSLSFTVLGYTAIFFGNSQWTLLFGYTAGCVGFSAYWFLSGIMMGDVVDEDYVHTGKNRQAMFSSVMALVNVPAQAILIWLFTYILDLFEYNGLAASQSDEALFGIRFGVAFLRVIFAIFTMIALIFYPLKGKRYAELRKKVEIMEIKRKGDLCRESTQTRDSESVKKED
jgi:GPH family glycoside/pentoside/hexuronide:cation symporter